MVSVVFVGIRTTISVNCCDEICLAVVIEAIRAIEGIDNAANATIGSYVEADDAACGIGD